jgi:sugar transferase (PEP-CTERM/EpsH1 system associated)
MVLSMNILYICHRLPYPPNKGEKIRAFHQLCYLATRHTIHLACLVDEAEDLQYVEALQKYCASIDMVYRPKIVAKLLALRALCTDQPLSVASFYSSVLAMKIRQRLAVEQVDRIVVFSSAMAVYVQQVCGIPKVADFVDADSEKWRLFGDYYPWRLSWVYRLEARRLARHEVEVARTFDHTIFVTDREAHILKEHVPDRPISIIPNGVDLKYFSPPTDRRPVTEPPALVFTGMMDYFPNVDAMDYFCREIFPGVREAVPAVRLYIVGRNPTPQIRQLSHQPNVIVTGAVPDVRPYLARARVAVAPLRIARGVQNKILEAMAMGLPVVGTPAALQGTWATPADGVRMAESPHAFIHQLVTLLKDPALQRQCALQARRYVQEHHQWDVHNARLEALLRETVAAPATACERQG